MEFDARGMAVKSNVALLCAYWKGRNEIKNLAAGNSHTFFQSLKAKKFQKQFPQLLWLNVYDSDEEKVIQKSLQ